MSVFNQCSKVNLSICQDILPEDGREIGVALLGLEVLQCLFDIGEVGVLQKVGFLCSGETTFVKVLPWWPASRFMPIPCVVTLVISIIIAGLFEGYTMPFRSRLGEKQVAWVRLGEDLSGSLSLTINVWFPRPILSKRVWAHREMVLSLVTSGGNCLHLCTIGFFEVFSIYVISLSALLWCE